MTLPGDATNRAAVSAAGLVGMKRDRGLTLKMALLLALLLDGESHRYELAGRFQERFGSFLPVETPSAIYGPLERLKRRGLVETRPAKRVKGPRYHRVNYAATEAAAGAHERWLTSPLRSPSWKKRRWRVELLGRIATVRETSQLRALIELYHQNALAEAKILKRLLEAEVPRRRRVLSLSDPHERKSLLLLQDLLLHKQRLILDAQARWAEWALAEIEGGARK